MEPPTLGDAIKVILREFVFAHMYILGVRVQVLRGGIERVNGALDGRYC